MIDEVPTPDENSDWQMTDFDFSHVNLEYLIQARDLASRNPQASALLLGIPDELAYQYTNLSPAGLTLVSQFKPPLVSPRLANWWWERLVQALTEGDPGELQVIMEHAGLLTDGLTGPKPNGDES